MKEHINITFYSPNGASWDLEGPEVHIDKSRIVTVPVRRYTYECAEYTVLACGDYYCPSALFYKLEVRRPKGTRFPVSSRRDFQIMKMLMETYPISEEQYIISQRKVLRKMKKRLLMLEMKRLEIVEMEKLERKELKCLDRKDNVETAAVEHAAKKVEKADTRGRKLAKQSSQSCLDMPNNVVAIPQCPVWKFYPRVQDNSITQVLGRVKVSSQCVKTVMADNSEIESALLDMPQKSKKTMPGKNYALSVSEVMNGLLFPNMYDVFSRQQQQHQQLIMTNTDINTIKVLLLFVAITSGWPNRINMTLWGTSHNDRANMINGQNMIAGEIAATSESDYCKHDYCTNVVHPDAAFGVEIEREDVARGSIIVDVDDDVDDFSGGVLRVYCRSG